MNILRKKSLKRHNINETSASHLRN